MSNALEQASLIMVPSGYEDGTLGSLKPTDGTGDFTFTRCNGAAQCDLAATRVNADGNIEKGYENLLKQSNSFDITWIKSGSPTIVQGETGYDGSNDAWLLTIPVSSNYIRQTISSSNIITYSVYAKAGSAKWINLFRNGTDVSIYFDLENGVASPPSSNNGFAYGMDDAGNDWYRCWIALSGSTSDIRIYAASDNNTRTTGTLYIQDAMVNQGLVAYPYVETTTAPVAGGILEDMPRLDYSNGSCPSLLLEPSRTNVITYSEYFETYFTNATLTSNYGISPEGVRNSTRVNFGSSNKYLATGFGGAAGTGSIYVKGVSGETITIGAGSVAGGSLHTLNGNWQRVSFYDDGTSPYFSINTYFGTARDIEVWGAQVEQDATYPTSYIPTYGVSQTRLGDVCRGAGDVNTFNSTEGVLYAEIAALADNGGFRLLSINDGTTGNRIQMYYSITSNRVNVELKISNLTQVNLSHDFPDVTEYNKIAFKYKQNDFSLWVNGIKVDSDLSGSVFSEGTLNNFDFALVSAFPFYGKVKGITYFPTALSDEECIALTTIS